MEGRIRLKKVGRAWQDQYAAVNADTGELHVYNGSTKTGEPHKAVTLHNAMLRSAPRSSGERYSFVLAPSKGAPLQMAVATMALKQEWMQLLKRLALEEAPEAAPATAAPPKPRISSDSSDDDDDDDGAEESPSPRRARPRPPEPKPAASAAAATAGAGAVSVIEAGFVLPDKAGRDEIFARFDYNGNGMLSLAEIDKAVMGMWPSFNNKPALMQAYKSADVSNDGFVDRTEFRLLLEYLAYYNGLWARFAEINSDGDRRLSLEEFVHAVSVVSDPDDASSTISEDEAELNFLKMDENAGGFVLFSEFCVWIGKRKVQPRLSKSLEAIMGDLKKRDAVAHAAEQAHDDPEPEAAHVTPVTPVQARRPGIMSPGTQLGSPVPLEGNLYAADSPRTLGAKAEEGEPAPVQVLVRVRPAAGPSSIVVDKGAKTIVLENAQSSPHSSVRSPKSQSYRFDSIFDARDTQEDMAEAVAPAAVRQVVDGFNSTIIAHGGEDSGKTFTMSGNLQTEMDDGLIMNVTKHLLEELQKKQFYDDTAGESHSVIVTASFLQILAGHVHDTLSVSETQEETGSLQVRRHAKLGTFVDGAVWQTISAPADVRKILRKRRELQGRCHRILTIKILRKFADGSVGVSKLSMVDLGGASMSKAKSQSRAAAAVKHGLQCLEKTFSALSMGDSRVPYRDSVLTSILQDSIGGNAHTTIVACIKLSDEASTKATLDFAQLAGTCDNTVYRSEFGEVVLAVMGAEVSKIEKLLLEASNERLKQVLNDTQRAIHYIQELIMRPFEGDVDAKTINHPTAGQLKDDGGAMVHAVKLGNIDAVRRLINIGTNVNTRSEGGETPLMVAASAGHSEIAASLLDAGADLGTANDQGHTALMKAAIAGKPLTIGLFCDRFEQHPDVCLTTKDESGMTALASAAWRGHAVVCKVLLEKGASVDQPVFSDQTALLLAASNGHAVTVQTLLDGNASVEAQDMHAENALTKAAAGGHSDVILELLAAGADCQARTQEGYVALHYAVLNGHTDAVNVLLLEGADISVRDKIGRTSLVIAVSSFADEILSALIEHDGLSHNNCSDEDEEAAIQAASGSESTSRLLKDALAVQRGASLLGMTKKDLIKVIEERVSERLEVQLKSAVSTRFGQLNHSRKEQDRRLKSLEGMQRQYFPSERNASIDKNYEKITQQSATIKKLNNRVEQLEGQLDRMGRLEGRVGRVEHTTSRERSSVDEASKAEAALKELTEKFEWLRGQQEKTLLLMADVVKKAQQEKNAALGQLSTATGISTGSTALTPEQEQEEEALLELEEQQLADEEAAIAEEEEIAAAEAEAEAAAAEEEELELAALEAEEDAAALLQAEQEQEQADVDEMLRAEEEEAARLEIEGDSASLDDAAELEAQEAEDAEFQEQEELWAATQLQSHFRGHQVRKFFNEQPQREAATEDEERLYGSIIMAALLERTFGAMEGDAPTDEAELRTAFDMFDVDGNGSIPQEELARVLRGCADDVTDEDVAEMMAEMDADGDGVIDYDEFIELIMGRAPE